MRSYAGPLNRPWVAHAYTCAAPLALRVDAAATSEPAVSIMSSLRMHTLSFTSPMSAVISAWLCFGRSLCMMAMSQSSMVENFFAAFARPTSGDTTHSLSLSKPMLWK